MSGTDKAGTAAATEQQNAFLASSHQALVFGRALSTFLLNVAIDRNIEIVARDQSDGVLAKGADGNLAVALYWRLGALVLSVVGAKRSLNSANF